MVHQVKHQDKGRTNGMTLTCTNSVQHNPKKTIYQSIYEQKNGCMEIPCSRFDLQWSGILFYDRHFQHIGTVTLLDGHRTRIDDHIARCKVSFFDQIIDGFLNRFVGG
jgi:hypothetical protein